MELQLIRNATLRLKYGGQTILIDPFLAAKHTIQSFAEISPNPLTDLPCEPDEVVSGVDVVLISHLHPDHFDEEAQRRLSKEIPILCQPGDEDSIASGGFGRVTPVSATAEWQGIKITRTPGQHGTGEWAERMGQVSGFVLRASGEPTVYWAGDTIWYDAIAEVIAEEQPDIIITHSGGARFGDSDPIIMDARQTVSVCQAAPAARIVAVHMESLDHCATSRADLRSIADESGVTPDRLLVPVDGEVILL